MYPICSRKVFENIIILPIEEHAKLSNLFLLIISDIKRWKIAGLDFKPNRRDVH